MSRFMIVPCIILMLGIRMPMAAEANVDEDSIEGAKGFGIGALVGALVGGPVGAIVGAAGGAYFAEQDAGKDRTIDDLEVRLDERDGQLAELRADFEQTQVAMTGDAAVLPGNPSAPISLPVYFRTDTATVDDSLRPHLTQLAAYLGVYPELEVRLEGYSDLRGDEEYNLALSQRRIDGIRQLLEAEGIAPERIRGYAYGETRATGAAGDPDAMVFDRAVVISVGEIDSTRA